MEWTCDSLVHINQKGISSISYHNSRFPSHNCRMVDGNIGSLCSPVNQNSSGVVILIGLTTKGIINIPTELEYSSGKIGRNKRKSCRMQPKGIARPPKYINHSSGPVRFHIAIHQESILVKGSIPCLNVPPQGNPSWQCN